MNPLFINRIRIDWSKITRNSYLRKIKAFCQLKEIEFHAPVTFFVGENGTGKSTLLEAMAVAYGFNPEGGTRNYHFSTYDSHSELNEAITLVKGYRKAKWGYFLRAESFYNVATQEKEYAGIYHPSEKYHEKSHGESFLQLVQKQFTPNGMYFLDEPEAALSPQRQLTLMIEIYRCIKENSQFIIATHSPILLGLPGAEILSFDHGAIKICQYEETESYLVTKSFVNNRMKMLKIMLGEKEVGNETGKNNIEIG